jgi:hypothetical protein
LPRRDPSAPCRKAENASRFPSLIRTLRAGKFATAPTSPSSSLKSDARRPRQT